MHQAFFIVLREGVESFLIVAITFAYLRKTGQKHLLRAVLWGVLGSIAVSGLLGFLLWKNQGLNQPLWEGVLAAVTAILVASLVVHMWKVGPHFKQDMERELAQATQKSSGSSWGVFLFTIVMMSREGMEMVLLLLQIQDSKIILGIFLGVLAAALIAVLWQQFGYLINMKKFFQITSVFFLLFTAQIAFQAFHEFSEAGVLPNSEALHAASEPFSTQGIYGKQYSNFIFFGCALWLVMSLVVEKLKSGSGSKLQNPSNNS